MSPPDQPVSAQAALGQPAVRVITAPADTNANGDIFGGWLVSQMDMGAGKVASRRARGRVSARTNAVAPATTATPMSTSVAMARWRPES